MMDSDWPDSTGNKDLVGVGSSFYRCGKYSNHPQGFESCAVRADLKVLEVVRWWLGRLKTR
jgi:hypothetical protein